MSQLLLLHPKNIYLTGKSRGRENTKGHRKRIPTCGNPTGANKTMSDIGDSVELVIMIVVAAFVGSALLPQAISKLTSTELTGASSGTQALWGMIPLFAVLAFALYFIYSALDYTNSDL